VIGPEVFLKALSIARNMGNPVRVFTTANFDIIPLRDYREPVDDHHPEYYYRPRKNVVNRPVMLGGRGYHIIGDHNVTLPNLYRMVMEQFTPIEPVNQQVGSDFDRQSPEAAAVLRADTRLTSASADLRRAFTLIARSWRTGGTLFVAADGATMRLFGVQKSNPQIPEEHQQRLRSLPGGEELARQLRDSPRVVDLRACSAVSTGVDAQSTDLELAQALYALAQPGDVLLGTGGENDRALHHALNAARLRGMYSVVVGVSPVDFADIVIAATAGEDAPASADAPANAGGAEWNRLAAKCLWAMLQAQRMAGEAQR
jgi:hypothetical protein